jgi:outer membrane protein assembly factor BamD (BamD/ComL family)
MKPLRIILSFAAVGCLALLTACQSVPKSVPEGLSAKEIIQRAQEAADTSNYKAAAFYYQTCKDRYSEDLSVVCACEYELAFISYKTGKYENAEAGFKALIDRYASPDAALLPQEYKILSEKILPKVQAKLSRTEKKKATGS